MLGLFLLSDTVPLKRLKFSELLLDTHVSNCLQNNDREYHATITKAGFFKKQDKGRYFRLGSNIPNRLNRPCNDSYQKPIVIHDSPRISAKDQRSKPCDSIVLIGNWVNLLRWGLKVHKLCLSWYWPLIKNQTTQKMNDSKNTAGDKDSSAEKSCIANFFCIRRFKLN